MSAFPDNDPDDGCCSGCVCGCLTEAERRILRKARETHRHLVQPGTIVDFHPSMHWAGEARHGVRPGPPPPLAHRNTSPQVVHQSDPIRAWLDVFDEMDPPPGRGDTEDGERMRAALRAVLDLCDQHALCAAGSDCTRDPHYCVSVDLCDTVASALGVTT